MLLRRFDRRLGEVGGLDRTRWGFFGIIATSAWVMRKRDGGWLTKKRSECLALRRKFWSEVSGLRTGGAPGYGVENGAVVGGSKGGSLRVEVKWWVSRRDNAVW